MRDFSPPPPCPSPLPGQRAESTPLLTCASPEIYYSSKCILMSSLVAPHVSALLCKSREISKRGGCSNVCGRKVHRACNAGGTSYAINARNFGDLARGVPRESLGRRTSWTHTHTPVTLGFVTDDVIQAKRAQIKAALCNSAPARASGLRVSHAVDTKRNTNISRHDIVNCFLLIKPRAPTVPRNTCRRCMSSRLLPPATTAHLGALRILQRPGPQGKPCNVDNLVAALHLLAELQLPRIAGAQCLA